MSRGMGNHDQDIRAGYFPGHLHALMQFAVDLNLEFRISGQSVRHDKRGADPFNAESVPVRMQKMFYGILPLPFI